MIASGIPSLPELLIILLFVGILIAITADIFFVVIAMVKKKNTNAGARETADRATNTHPKDHF
jgi:hypothetical protein|tara:strand:+ start:295 stop:483 length:189 start_codon:yes stop_codon:yes gene_type:complete